MPDTSLPRNTPVCGPANIPSQQRIRSSTLTRDPARLQLSEVRLEETDLVFSIDTRLVGSRFRDAEVVPNLS
jgi:hypothetical protein